MTAAMARIPDMPASAGPALIDRMPALRGRVSAWAELGRTSWFRVGGPAEVLARPADADDLATLLAGLPGDVPVTVIGVASNLLVRDGGVPGVVVKLGRGFADIRPDGTDVIAGAAALDVNIAKVAAAAGIAGLEFLVGVPGTLGGGLRMNAGAYGRELRDVLVEAYAIDRAGRHLTLDLDAMAMDYRHCGAPDDLIFTGARLRGGAGDPAEIAARMAAIQVAREQSQPIRSRTGGSTFANPPGAKAWKLIDRAGCRGLRLGGAQVSEQHCNFLINTGDATAADLEDLGETVRARVLAATGVTLRWEIRRIGVRAPQQREDA
ncbi:MAG: UDP-N-acetylmuramate dehydrogenase [Alphaproteobacteria bacterium]